MPQAGHCYLLGDPPALVQAAEADDFVADGGDNRQQSYAGKNPPVKLRPAQEDKHQNGYQHYREQEGGSAAGMGCFEFPYVFDA